MSQIKRHKLKFMRWEVYHVKISTFWLTAIYAVQTKLLVDLKTVIQTTSNEIQWEKKTKSDEYIISELWVYLKWPNCVTRILEGKERVNEAQEIILRNNMAENFQILMKSKTSYP